MLFKIYFSVFYIEKIYNTTSSFWYIFIFGGIEMGLFKKIMKFFGVDDQEEKEIEEYANYKTRRQKAEGKYETLVAFLGGDIDKLETKQPKNTEFDNPYKIPDYELDLLVEKVEFNEEVCPDGYGWNRTTIYKPVLTVEVSGHDIVKKIKLENEKYSRAGKALSQGDKLHVISPGKEIMNSVAYGFYGNKIELKLEIRPNAVYLVKDENKEKLYEDSSAGRL